MYMYKLHVSREVATKRRFMNVGKGSVGSLPDLALHFLFGYTPLVLLVSQHTHAADLALGAIHHRGVGSAALVVAVHELEDVRV
jgi:hypothetical protein